MDPARYEALCFCYVGVLFTGCAGLLVLSTGDLNWAITLSTGPVFLALGVYWLVKPDARSRPPTEFGPRLYAITALALVATVVVGGILSLQFL
jgi:hypothetical protein